MREYLRAGICGFGIGSNLVKKSLIEQGDHAAIAELARDFLSALREAEQ